MALFEDFIKIGPAWFRGPHHPEAHVPFSKKSVEAGLVLADGFEERGQLIQAERLRSFIDDLGPTQATDARYPASSSLRWQLLYDSVYTALWGR